MTDLARSGAALLGGQLARAVTVSGGDLSGVVHIVLADGRDAIVKGGPAPRAEAAMLEALGAAGTPVPAVLAVDDRVLVLERLATDGGPVGAWADLGRVLARTGARQTAPRARPRLWLGPALCLRAAGDRQ